MKVETKRIVRHNDCQAITDCPKTLLNRTTRRVDALHPCMVSLFSGCVRVGQGVRDCRIPKSICK